MSDKDSNVKLRDILGQEHITSLLEASLASGRISHAYLFTGPKGTGKTTTAKAFAMSLNCKARGDKVALPCYECPSCQKIMGSNHPDFKVIEPSGLSIKIEQVRQIQRDVALRSYEGGWKVFIIEDAETMTPEAGNSLLKVLEEPPGDSVLILISHNYLEVLQTIRSRCQVMEFRKLSVNLVEKFLIERYSLSPEEALLIANLADGAPGKAVRLHGDEGFLSQRNQVLDAISAGSEGKLFEFSNDMEASKEEARDAFLNVLDILKTWYRDLIVYSYSRDTSLLINQDKRSKIIEKVQDEDMDRLPHIIQRIDDVREDVERTKGANLPLALDTIFLEILGNR